MVPHARALTQHPHMPKSKSQETCQVCFSCIKTFYPPAAYSPSKRNMFSKHFKTLFFNTLWLRMISNCASVSMACKFNSNINKSLVNYYSFTSINTMSIKYPWRLQLFISCIGTKCCGGCLHKYCYWGCQHDRCKSFALPVIISHDCHSSSTSDLLSMCSPVGPRDLQGLWEFFGDFLDIFWPFSEGFPHPAHLSAQMGWVCDTGCPYGFCARRVPHLLSRVLDI